MRIPAILAVLVLGCGAGVHGDPASLTSSDGASASCGHATATGMIGDHALVSIQTAYFVHGQFPEPNTPHGAPFAISLTDANSVCGGSDNLGDMVGLQICRMYTPTVGTYAATTPCDDQAPTQMASTFGYVVRPYGHGYTVPDAIAGGSTTITSIETNAVDDPVCVSGTYTILFPGSGGTPDMITGDFRALPCPANGGSGS